MKNKNEKVVHECSCSSKPGHQCSCLKAPAKEEIPASVVNAMNAYFGKSEITEEYVHELINVYESLRSAHDRIFAASYGEFIVLAYYESDKKIAIVIN